MRSFNKILVTGGYGFIGSHMIKAFIKNHKNTKIVNIDKLTYAGNEDNLIELESNKNYSFKKIDIVNIQSLKGIFNDNEFDAVIHFAAESHVDRSIENPRDFIDTNIIGTYNLLSCSLDQHNKTKDFIFFHVSTDEVYGSLEFDEPPFKESNNYLPRSPYASSKAASDHLVRAWNNTYKLPILITNCSNNYGPNQYPEKLIPSIILNALTGQQIKIYGNGHAIRDWLYVEDHCEAIDKVLHHGQIGETYNIGGNSERKNITIANEICSILDNLMPPDKKFLLRSNKSLDISSYSDLITFVEERPGHDQRYAIDANKIKKDLGWSPAKSLSKGLTETVEWYLSNTEWLINILNKK